MCAQRGVLKATKLNIFAKNVERVRLQKILKWVDNIIVKLVY